jgi:hypothetical protein
MYSQYNWLFDVDSIGQFFKRLGIIVLSIILFLIYIIVVGSGVSALILNNSKNKGHILIIIPILSSIICMITPGLVIVLIIVYFLFRKDFINNGKSETITSSIYQLIDDKSKVDKKYIILFVSLIIVSILLFLYFVNNYYVVFDNKIQKRNILSSKESSFDFQYIKEVSLGVKNRGKYGGSLYYKVILENGLVINAANNIIAVEDELAGLQKFNNVIKRNNIKRSIDKTHFHDLVEDLGEEYVREYEKIFEE